MTEAKRSLHRKLAEVMAEAERIPKNGTYTGQGGFKYVLVGDAADAIRKALAARNVSMLPTQVDITGESEHETRSGGTMTTQTIRTTWTLTDGDTGETAIIQSLGTGADAGDKYSPKAQTNAMKYALLMGFLLSTGDDPEQADTSDRRARRSAAADEAPDEPTRSADGGLIGTAELGKGNADFEIRQTPRGPLVAFRLKQGRKGMKVEAYGSLAMALHGFKAETLGQRVTCWGSIRMETFTKEGRDIDYPIMTLERIQTPTYTAPGTKVSAKAADSDVEAELDRIADEVMPEPMGLVE